MLNFIIYNIVVYGVYSLIDFFCVKLGIYQSLSFSNLTNTTIYIMTFNIFISTIAGYFIMRYLKKNFLFDK
jgi:hypothetical protein